MGTYPLLQRSNKSNRLARPLGITAWVLFAILSTLVIGLTGASLAAYVRTDSASAWMRGEGGFVEMATFVIALAAAVLASVAAWCWKGAKAGRAWLIMLAIGGAYWAGEEVSWGQRWLGFSTPAAYAEINAQKETTLHNIEFKGKNRRALRMLVDYLPRSLITVGAVLCLILPFVPGTKGRVLTPHIACIPPAIAVILLDAKAFGDIPSGGEVTELLMSVMLIVYLVALAPRLKS